MSGLTDSYKTADELAYLRDLGSHRDGPTMVYASFPPRIARWRLLRRYLATMPYRQRWGDVDRGVCEEFAKKLLADEHVG